ncbi:hypothetical protein AVEN_265714-1 [Araneus ventricosus]|uniref:Uncharacterized protein n=1 Tax=Araneus ventricosus TaxID=182803 RepID=A0A4Y2NYS0_ARAVE|nr:hypothetical protein AVEN_265714-1 [Araneus ventricosus]
MSLGYGHKIFAFEILILLISVAHLASAESKVGYAVSWHPVLLIKSIFPKDSSSSKEFETRNNAVFPPLSFSLTVSMLFESKDNGRNEVNFIYLQYFISEFYLLDPGKLQDASHILLCVDYYVAMRLLRFG